MCKKVLFDMLNKGERTGSAVGVFGLSGRFGVSDKVLFLVHDLVELCPEGFVLELQVKRPFLEGLKAEEGTLVPVLVSDADGGDGRRDGVVRAGNATEVRSIALLRVEGVVVPSRQPAHGFVNIIKVLRKTG